MHNQDKTEDLSMPSETKDFNQLYTFILHYGLVLRVFFVCLSSLLIPSQQFAGNHTSYATEQVQSYYCLRQESCFPIYPFRKEIEMF